MEFLLFIIARMLQIIIGPVLFTYGIVRAITKWELKWYLKQLAMSIDAFGNVLGQYAFNDLLGVGYGNRKELISSRLGKNERDETEKILGPSVANILNFIDKNHCKNSIDENV